MGDAGTLAAAREKKNSPVEKGGSRQTPRQIPQEARMAASHLFQEPGSEETTGVERPAAPLVVKLAPGWRAWRGAGGRGRGRPRGAIPAAQGGKTERGWTAGAELWDAVEEMAGEGEVIRATV